MLTVGNALAVPVTGISIVFAPGEVPVILPELLPAGAVAAKRTYTGTLFTVPPTGKIVKLLPKPVVGERDISKPLGPVKEMGPVKAVADTSTC